MIPNSVIDMTGGLLGDKSIQDIILLTQGGTVREWSEVLPDGRTVTYTAEVEEEVIEEEEDIVMTGSRVLTTCSKENNHQVETVSSVAEGEVIRVTKTHSRWSYRRVNVLQISDLI